MTDIRRQIESLKARIATLRARKTAAGKLEAKLVTLVLKQLRNEIRADKKRAKAA